ncbi:MAG: hypothetical protein M1818_008498 [Claussenomyces sp. TS43310]|nr:MAG: hypothetical protein M1818_008498 [Claussenomyces sp. TS43310]
MGALSSVALPAFSALVCPYNWGTINYNETYIVCCPNKFGVNAPNYADNTDRPFSGAACTSSLGPDELYDITSYDSTAYWTVVPTSAPDGGTVVRVNAFDGIAATAAATTTTTSSVSPTRSTSSTSISTPCTPAATVSVNFRVPFAVTDTAAGENINLIGSTDFLGGWVIADSIRMSDDLYTTANPLWETTVAFPAGTYVEYKYLHILANGSVVWSLDPNYSMTVSTGCAKTETMNDVWR